MKRRFALSVLGLLLVASAGLAASKKVSVVEELILVKLPPAAQKPREISSWHEAYLNDYKLMGTMLLKGENREAAVDLAQQRGAHLVKVNFSKTLITKFSSRVLYERPVGPGLKEVVTGKKMKESPGFYLEMYSPGRDYQEGAKRFCANTMPYALSGKGYYVCGTMEDMKRYLDLGADPTPFLYRLVREAYEIACYADMRRVSDILPEMRRNLEMIVLTLDRGADALTVSGETAYMLGLLTTRLRTNAPQAENASQWPPQVADPGQRAGADFALAFFVEVQRIVDEWAKR